MFDGLKQLFLNLKESRAWEAVLSMGFRGPQWMSGNYTNYAQEGYGANATVYACINKTYSAFTGVKYGAYRQKGEGMAPVTKGPLADLIKHPNNRQGFARLAGEWAASMELTGNAYWEGISTDGRDATILKALPRELYLLRPDRMFVVPSNDPQMPIAGFEYRAGSQVVSYPFQLWRDPRTGGYTPRTPVCHSKYWNPLPEDGDWYGLSPVKAASRNIDAFNSAVAWNVGLTQNVARPSGVFSSDQAIPVNSLEEYTNKIRQKFSGASNAGRPMVLGQGLKWQQMGLSPVDMDWLKGLQWNLRQICAIFGIPPQLVSDEEAKTYANFEEASRAVWNQKWLNMLDMMCGDLNTWLAPLFWDFYGEEVYIGYDRDGIEAIQEDRQIKWKNTKDAEEILTVDERRALVGYKPLGAARGGDVILVPSNKVPLHIAATQDSMPSLALSDRNAAHTQNTTRLNARIQARQGQESSGQKPPKALPAGNRKKVPKQPKEKQISLPAEKASEVIDAEFVDLPTGDVLLKQIEATRERLKLLSH